MAAVACILRPAIRGAGLYDVLLIQRAASVYDPWSGDVAFPGGRFQKEDLHSLDTAIRETQEEIGVNLDSKDFELIGRVAPNRPVATTRQRGVDVFLYAFLYRSHAPLHIDQNVSEVASTFWAPLESVATVVPALAVPLTRFAQSSRRRKGRPASSLQLRRTSLPKAGMQIAQYIITTIAAVTIRLFSICGLREVAFPAVPFAVGSPAAYSPPSSPLPSGHTPLPVDPIATEPSVADVVPPFASRVALWGMSLRLARTVYTAIDTQRAAQLRGSGIYDTHALSGTDTLPSLRTCTVGDARQAGVETIPELAVCLAPSSPSIFSPLPWHGPVARALVQVLHAVAGPVWGIRRQKAPPKAPQGVT